MTDFNMSAELQTEFAAYMKAKREGKITEFASGLGRDRLVRKEDALGQIREILPPRTHIGLDIAPFLPVDTDDVVFDYIKEFTQDGLTPARAEDAESELSQKDNLPSIQGRASVIDWAEKDKYTASDVTRYRDNLLLSQLTQGAGANLNLNDPGNAVAQFNARVARDDLRRRRRLDNRIEWMIQQGLWTGGIAYNDGKIKFTVTFGRPAGQQDTPLTVKWDAGTTHDPIADILALKQTHYDTYGVNLRTAITSQKVLNTIWKSSKFTALAGVVGGTPSSPIDLNYLLPGWDPQFAIAAVERVTGITFRVYDAVYRTRPIGSATVTNVRFSPEKNILFLPDQGELNQISDTELGFGKVLTSPHPEGNWTSGFYEWEETQEHDPWMTMRGSGIKAFPVFPLLQYSTTVQALT